MSEGGRSNGPEPHFGPLISEESFHFVVTLCPKNSHESVLHTFEYNTIYELQKLQYVVCSE